jgi:hypothetical protein
MNLFLGVSASGVPCRFPKTWAFKTSSRLGGLLASIIMPSLMSIFVAWSAIVPSFAEEPTVPITQVIPEIDKAFKWDDSKGDTADPFWADDDQLYHFACDGRGFGTQERNLCFNKLSGSDLFSLKGSLVNSMDEYGGNGASMNGTSTNDGGNWKAVGQECVDGVFYCFVARNHYGNHSKDPLLRQTSLNASLIKSTDHGLTWTRSAQENYDHPMWPGSRFGAPAFIHYGRNGGQVARDGADKYVYAVSNNGFWNGGDDLILARVLRTDLPKLNVSDWEYFTGGEGLMDSSWSHDIGKAAPILSRPAKLGWTAPVFIPCLNRYLLVSWYITPTLKGWFNPERLVYDFFEAPHPWGPWNQVGSMDDSFLANSRMYGPNLCAKYQEQTPDGVRIQLFSSGTIFKDVPGSIYKIWRFPLLLRKNPLPEGSMINDTDPAIRYSKGWQAVAQASSRDYQKDYHLTRSPGATAEYRFSGSGLEIWTGKNQSNGSFDVLIDGKPAGTIDTKLRNFQYSGFVQVPVFRIENLTPGDHEVKIIVKGDGNVAFDAFRILK